MPDADQPAPEAIEAAIERFQGYAQIYARSSQPELVLMAADLGILVAAVRAGQEALSAVEEQDRRAIERNRANDRGWLDQPIKDAEIRDIRQDYGGRSGLNSVIIERMLRTIEAGQEAQRALTLLDAIGFVETLRLKDGWVARQRRLSGLVGEGVGSTLLEALQALAQDTMPPELLAALLATRET